MKPRPFPLFAPADVPTTTGGAATAPAPAATKIKDYKSPDPGALAASIMADQPPPKADPPAPATTPEPKQPAAAPKVTEREIEIPENPDEPDEFSGFEKISLKSKKDEAPSGEETATHEEPRPTEEAIPEGPRGLRENLRTANTELRLARERIAELESNGDTRVKDLEEQVRRGHDSRVVRDPVSHPDVQAIIRPFDEKLIGYMRELNIDGQDHTAAHGIVTSKIGEFSQIASGPDSPEYMAALRKIRAEIGEQFPKDVASKLVKLVDEGSRVAGIVGSKVRDIVDNSNTYEFHESSKAYDKHAREWSDYEKGWVNPSEDAIENDPYSPAVFMHKAAKEDPEVAKQISAVKKQVKATLMALPPVDPRALEGKTADQVAAYYETRQKNHSNRLKALYSKIGDYVAFHQLGPDLLQAQEERKAALGDVRATTPVPSGSGALPASGAKEPVTVKGYTPPALPKDLGH